MAFAQQSHPKFDSLANELVSNTTIPSVVFSYITPDTCLYGVAGVNNLNDKKEVELTDKFSLGSNTKAITALIAMKMVEKEQITLDTKLLEVIPSLKRKIKKTYRKIIPKHVLAVISFMFLLFVQFSCGFRRSCRFQKVLQAEAERTNLRHFSSTYDFMVLRRETQSSRLKT